MFLSLQNKHKIYSFRVMLILLIGFQFPLSVPAQTDSTHSVAKQWIDAILNGIKQDGQGPTVHARNIFHLSAAMYDAWAVFEENAEPYLLGNTIGEFQSSFKGFEPTTENLDSLQRVAICYAAFSLLEKRYSIYGSKHRVLDGYYNLLWSQGLTEKERSTDYTTGSASALGNYIGEQYFLFGDTDGSNEENRHENQRYEPFNPAFEPGEPGVGNLKDPNRWQPIDINNFVKIKGIDVTLPEWNWLFVTDQTVFTTPEWGDVIPFSLDNSDLTILEREGDWNVYLDPGSPPLLSENGLDSSSINYKWGFALNAVWSSFLDPQDSVRIDISPSALGNIKEYPNATNEYDSFYDLLGGGVRNANGHKVNPYTDKPYPKNEVLRADYLRVIAEYWVDAINTYSPPGHWMDHLSLTSYDPKFERRWKGKGEPLSQIDWDIKSYFTLAGAMHDAAISCWSVKGYYDYVRPITAIRYMASKGQSSDSLLPNYHPHGLPLIENHIELVTEGDPLIGDSGENIHKMKIRAWRGPNTINDPFTETAGVGWILGENWWPYQRYSFATPTFAGYVSGHSTFSPCGAEVLTIITGNPFFPGGMHTFTAKAGKFLEFEDGPTEDITLQWATYHDAAAETCLSRIYGGIHPPCDDIPGRKIGISVAKKAVSTAEEYFD